MNATEIIFDKPPSIGAITTGGAGAGEVWGLWEGGVECAIEGDRGGSGNSVPRAMCTRPPGRGITLWIPWQQRIVKFVVPEVEVGRRVPKGTVRTADGKQRKPPPPP